MPLTPKIGNAIPAQNAELIRDQIGAVLLVEFTNQSSNYSLPANCTPSAAQIEGFLQIDESTLPIIIVRLVSAEEQQKDSSGNAIYECCYYIDVYAADASTLDARGDQMATLALEKMIGIIRSILEDPRYDLLGFTDGAINIWNTKVDNWYINLPKNTDDAADAICGRVEFHVTETEVPSSYIATSMVTEVDTNVKLLNTERGYFWKMLEQEINISSTGTTLTNAFFTNPIGKILIGDATYILNTDYTQNIGTMAITATTFEFTIDTVIIAKTS